MKLQPGPRIYWKQNSGIFLESIGNKKEKKKKDEAGKRSILEFRKLFKLYCYEVLVSPHQQCPILSHILHLAQQISSEVPFQALPCQSP